MSEDSPKETKILIVDDTPTNIEVLWRTLEPRGYKIQIATSGEIALKVLEKAPFPDLILLDIMMPGIDGYETCRRMKMDQAICDIPVIFLTGKSDIKDIVRGFEVGGVDYVTKPFSQEEVYARVKTHVLLKKTLLEKEELIEQLRISSKTDPLTSLLNRRGVMESLEIEAHRFERSKKCFSIVLSDIDHFKNVNDTYGHEAGDKILVEVGKIIRENCRKQDVASRWGGEEFLILLPETDLEGGKLLAEKIRKAIESNEFFYQEQKIPITMSFGLSIFFENSKNLEDCIRYADDCLYNAKKMGRNRVVNKIN
jgi:diguanylate cyclase (GGDEF)-like protein